MKILGKDSDTNKNTASKRADTKKQNITGNKEIPRIGMRIIKSAAGIFICFLIDYFRGGSGIVFYSQLAVLWCIRDYVSETKQFAFQRTVGTVIGALYGLLYIVGKRFVGGRMPAESVADGGFGGLRGIFLSGSFWDALTISVIIVFVLYTTVLLKQKQASYFSCVVFLSIVINHSSDLNPYLFVWNRFLDTMIGIIVGVVVNCVSIHGKKNKDVLFLSGLDDTLLAPGGEISAYSRVELNRMIERGVHFTVSTIRTPASLIEPLRGIKVTLPVIAMDGAALYNLADNSYEKVYLISGQSGLEIQEFLRNNDVDYFSNVVIEDVLLIYYMESESKYYNETIAKMRKSPFRNYIRHDAPVQDNVVYFMVVDEEERIQSLYEKIKNEKLFEDLKITVSKSGECEGCSLLKIYNRNATKENMLHYLKEKLGISETITFGTVEGKYTHTIKVGDFNRVVKLMKKES